jgi:hypothetical protein
MVVFKDKIDMIQPKKIGDHGSVDNAMEVLSDSGKKGWLSRVTSDLYAAAVDYVGVANIFTFMNTIPLYARGSIVRSSSYEEAL